MNINEWIQAGKPINTVVCGDCIEGLKKLPDNSVDLVLTDPPYNISYKSNHRKKSKKYYKNEWDKHFNLIPYFKEMLRILKNDSVMIVFSRFDSMINMINISKETIPHSVLIWNKMDYGMGDLNWFSLSYEIMQVYKKGNPKLNKLNGKRPNGIFNVVKVQNFASSEANVTGDERQDFMLHPTQKPIKLISDLIKICSNENDIVLDPFMGSGTTAVACKQLNRQFIGFEISKKYCDIAEKRLKAVPKRLDNFMVKT